LIGKRVRYFTRFNDIDGKYHASNHYAVLFVDQDIEERARRELLNFDDNIFFAHFFLPFLLI
jgi:hypothetical protein